MLAHANTGAHKHWRVCTQTMVFEASSEPVTRVVFSPDDERVAGVTMDGKVVVFEVDSLGGCGGGAAGT